MTYISKQVASDQNMTYMSKQVSEANKAAEAAHRETRDMQHALNMRPPPEELESLKDKMKALREALKEGEDASRQRIRDLEKEKANLMERLGSMTPRPSWEPVKKHGVEIGSKTQDTVFAAAARLAEFVSDQKDLASKNTIFAAAARLAEFVSDQKDLASKAQLQEALLAPDSLPHKAQLLEALLAPDPLPYEVSLTITTDSSAYFITEEEGDEKERAPSQAEGLGLAPSVSRCLRWAKGEKITLAHFTLARLEDAILQIWKAKRVYDRSHVGQPLHSYLYTFYLAALGQTPTGSTAHQRVAASTYSLYAACADHAQSSATVRLFWAVLSGLVSEEVQKEQALMVTALRHMVSRLPLAVLPAEVLSGLVSEEVQEEQALMVTAHRHTVSRLPLAVLPAEAAPSEATPTEPAGTEGDVASSSQEDAPAQALLSPEERAAPRVSSQDVLDILDAMFPSRVSYKLNKLKEALTLQFRGETIILAHLLAALEPHVLPPLLGGAHSPVVTDEDDEHLEMGEFVATLLEQHLTDVESQSSDALAKLAATEAAPLPETSAASIDPATTVISIASAMASLQDAGVDEQGVVASVARALDLNFPLQGDQSSALKMVLEMLAPAVLETASFCTSLQQQCMLRCSPTYDLEKATSLGDRKIAAAAQGPHACPLAACTRQRKEQQGASRQIEGKVRGGPQGTEEPLSVFLGFTDEPVSAFLSLTVAPLSSF
eukprot:gene26370-17464_t